jgi:hypothetical protein
MSTTIATTPNRPAPIFLAECRYGRLGNAFRETDRDSNSRDEIVSLIRSREIAVIKVIEIDEVEGTCRDVTEDLLREVEETLIEGIPEDEPREWHVRKHQVA